MKNRDTLTLRPWFFIGALRGTGMIGFGSQVEIELDMSRFYGEWDARLSRLQG